MKMRRLIVAPVIAGLMLLTVGCTNPFAPNPPTAKETTADPEIKAAVEQYVAKYNAHDAEGAGSFYADNPTFRWIEDGRVVYETRTAAVAGLTGFMAGFGESRLEAYDVKISMLNDDAAIASFKFTQVIAANGQASLKLEGVMTMALTNADGDWKILVGHKSSHGFPN
ncbi:MAG: nuclear transport factor 2 family protein [Alphaproteobacteria bacterium]|nr:nuclear transport factor 2 family protein [Alphaproteobacteria bacterium]